MTKPSILTATCPRCGQDGGYVSGMEQNAETGLWTWRYLCYSATCAETLYEVTTIQASEAAA